MKIAKTCIPSSKECWSDGVKSLSGKTGYLKNNDSRYSYMSFVLEDGQSIFFWVGGFLPTDTAGDRHAQIWIDIDGPNKGSKTLGKDIFGMGVSFETNTVDYIGMKSGVTRKYLMGINHTDNFACNKDVDHMYSGRYCGALIQIDGWQIRDDYPVKF